MPSEGQSLKYDCLNNKHLILRGSARKHRTFIDSLGYRICQRRCVDRSSGGTTGDRDRIRQDYKKDAGHDFTSQSTRPEACRDRRAPDLFCAVINPGRLLLRRDDH